MEQRLIPALPPETWLYIASFVSNLADLNSLSRTSKPFSDVTRQILYRRVSLFSGADSQRQTINLLSNRPDIARNVRYFSTSDLSFALSENSEDNNGIELFVSALRNMILLEELCIVCSFRSPTDQTKFFKAIRKHSIHINTLLIDTWHEGDSSATASDYQISDVENLRIEFFGEDPDYAGLFRLIASSLNTLLSLTLPSLDDDDDTEFPLWNLRFPVLQSLDIGFFDAYGSIANFCMCHPNVIFERGLFQWSYVEYEGRPCFKSFVSDSDLQTFFLQIFESLGLFNETLKRLTISISDEWLSPLQLRRCSDYMLSKGGPRPVLPLTQSLTFKMRYTAKAKWEDSKSALILEFIAMISEMFGPNLRSLLLELPENEFYTNDLASSLGLLPALEEIAIVGGLFSKGEVEEDRLAVALAVANECTSLNSMEFRTLAANRDLLIGISRDEEGLPLLSSL